MTAIAQLEAALGFPLTETPLQGRDPGWAAMPCLRDPAGKKEGWLAMYAQRDGHLTGLNLAGRGLTDAQWQKATKGLDLSRLEALNLRGNQLHAVVGLEQLHGLRYLDLSDNQLEVFVPPAGADKLEHVFLQGNKDLGTPPPEIVARGRYELAQYFQALRKQGSTKLYEAKVLILGAGGVGKTTLRRKLLNGIGAPMPTEEESTHGIEVEDMAFKCTETDHFLAHLWDFGGQEIYHATHQFFLTTRSLYIVVTDERKEDTNFGYWLQIIELLGGNSPIIIVQNEKGGRRSDIGILALQRQFPQVKSLHSLNLKEDGKLLKQLTDDVKNQLSYLEHAGFEWPASWAAIRQELQNIRTREKRHFITLERYFDLCEQRGQTEDEALRISQFLHDLGATLHFQSDPILKRTVILDNDWATAGVYQVLDDRNIQDQKGYFSKQEAVTIWSDMGRQNYNAANRRMADDLLQLMLKFEICYRLPETLETEASYVAPQLLPTDAPEAAVNWDQSGNLQLRYQYEFMPKGVMSRLMVRLHRYIGDYKTDSWRSGAILRRGKAILRIQENYLSKNLHLHCTGSDAKELVTIVSDEIDNLNNSYDKFKQRKETGQTGGVKKLVPCLCSKCLNDTEPNFHTYEKLLRAKELGRDTVECERIFENVNVLQLMDNVFVKDDFNRHKGIDIGLIKDLIAAGKIEKALDQLPHDDYGIALALKQRYASLKAEKLKGVLGEPAYQKERNSISNDLLEYLGYIKAS